ncbi:MAG TPA: PHP domain-containing protein [Syntrophales bacterium]|nr:PHP domain-containing protein [Syntrophales bacterium]HOO00084.1 PHP domain-containing protein [Syntrophales bacterium]
MLRGQFHVHTTFSDGTMTPEEVVSAYERLGFHFLAVTDHDHLLKPSYGDTIAALDSPLLIFTGIELTIHCRKGYVHVSRIEGEREVLHIFNHPADLGVSPRECARLIAEVAAVQPIDAVEVTSHGFYTPEFDIPEIPYPKVAADDAHTPSGCGRCWVELDGALEKDAIIRAVKEGRFVNCFAAGEVKRKPTKAPRIIRFA